MRNTDRIEATARKIVSWRFTAFLAVILIIMTLLPILWIAVYNVPCADDFNYGLMTHHTWMKTHNLFHVFKMSLREVKNFYLHWQGTWFAIWLMSLQPAVFSESLYPLGTVMQLISLLGGLYFLLKTLIVDIAHEARSKCVIIWAIISTICIQFLPSASQGLFWYNGSVLYTFFYGISGCSAWGFPFRAVIFRWGRRAF